MSSLRRTFAIVALTLVLAPLAARAPLFDPDEGLHAAIAQEMARSGDYVTPRFLGEPFLDKPILFFWAEALSLKVFGMNEAAVRIPPLLFGVLGMATAALAGGALFGEAAGLIAGVVYGTMLLPLGVSEVAVHDVAVVPFMCAGVYFLVAVASGRRSVLSCAAAGVCLGLAILTKGLVGVVFAGIFAGCYGLARPATIVRLAVAFIAAVLLAVAIAAPWYIAMEHAHPGYLHYYFVERHLQGYLTATQRHAGRGPWYYLPIVAGGALPWTGYLVSAARAIRPDRLRIVIWSWFAIGLVFLSIGESKLATYALPLFPALAILIGETIASSGGRIDRVGYGVYSGTLAALPLAAVAALQIKYGGVETAYWIVCGAISVAIAIVSVPRTPCVPWLDFSAAAPTLSLMALFGLMVVAPRAATWMTSRDVARRLNADGRLPPHVLVLEERIGSLIFYLDPALRAQATPARIDRASMAEALQRSRIESLDGVVIVRNNLLRRFERQFPAAPVPAWMAGTNTVYRIESLQKALRGEQR